MPNYFTLRIVSVVIRLAAVATGCFVIVMFMATVDRQYTARINARTLSQQINQQLEASSAQTQALTAQAEALLRQAGIDMDLDAYTYTPNTSLGSPATPDGNDFLRSITLQNIQDLFFGMVASLLIFGFGGMLSLLVDIASQKTVIDYTPYSRGDSYLAPTAPGSDYRRKPIPPPPGTYDERLRDQYGRR